MILEIHLPKRSLAQCIRGEIAAMLNAMGLKKIRVPEHVKAEEIEIRAVTILKYFGLRENDVLIETFYTAVKDLSGRETPYFRLINKKSLRSGSPEIDLQIKIVRELNKIMDVEVTHYEFHFAKGEEPKH